MSGTWQSPGDSEIRVLRLYADEDGESHFSVEDDTALDSGAASSVRLRTVPAGWRRDWGPAHHRTVAVYVAGEGVVEASDGESHRVHPGVILVVEDTTGRGHAARVVGDESLVVVHITALERMHRANEAAAAAAAEPAAD